jgi:hypothetical protein
VYEIKDRTKANSGYLQVARDGRRVCDFYPFAAGADAEWVRDQARTIVAVMNGAGTNVTPFPSGGARPRLVG